MPSESQKQPTGPALDLISRINHLALLLKNLPLTLPLDPDHSTYKFGIDPDDEREEGLYYAFNHNLEVCFGTHKLQGKQLHFKERGDSGCYQNLIKMFKKVAKELPDQREFLREHWLERLITAANATGAKIPDKCVLLLDFQQNNKWYSCRRKAAQPVPTKECSESLLTGSIQEKKRELSELTDGEEIEDVTDDVIFKKARVDQQRLRETTTQRSLDFYKWPKLDKEEKLEHSQKEFAKMRDDMDAFRTAEEEKRTLKKQHTRELARERQQRHRDRLKSRKAAHAGKPVRDALKSSAFIVDIFLAGVASRLT